jgi:hypothetical protein
MKMEKKLYARILINLHLFVSLVTFSAKNRLMPGSLEQLRKTGLNRTALILAVYTVLFFGSLLVVFIK